MKGTIGTDPSGNCPSPQELSANGGGYYQIIVGGFLDQQWGEWFGDLTISHSQDGDSTLSGFITDQSALHGILAQIRDLGLILVSLNRKEMDTS